MLSSRNTFKRTLLNKIHLEDLKKILAPIKEELMGLDMWIENSVPEDLASFLHNTDTLPADKMKQVESDLHLINAIAKEECTEYIKDKLGSDYSKDDDVYSMAAKLLFKERDSCKEIAARTFSQQTFNCEFFISSLTISSKIPMFEVSQIEKLEKEFKEFFDREGKSSFLYIYPHNDENFICLTIEHGTSRVRETTIEENKPAVFSYRPYVRDIIRINKTTGEVLIHLEKESKKLTRRYKMSIGNLIVPDGQLSPYEKFDLSPLKLGKKSLNLKKLDRKIELAILKKVYFSGNRLSGHIYGLDCINEVKKLSNRKIKFTTAEFEFKFSDAKNLISATLKDGNKARIPSCPQYNIIEEFFTQNKFLRPDAYEKTLPLS